MIRTFINPPDPPPDWDAIRRRVFLVDDAFVNPFSSQTESRAIIHGYRFDFCEPALKDGFLAAMNAVAEREFLVLLLDRAEGERNDWSFSVEVFQDYCRNAGPFENEVISTKATWGVLFSHEGHALVGGSRTFVDTLLDVAGLDPIEEASKLARAWANEYLGPGATLDWLEPLLRSFVGRRHATRIMREAGVA